MTDPHDPIHATDLDIADARSAPARSGDSLVVHGMLSMISTDEPRRLEARIQRAIDAVRAETEASPVLARVGPGSVGLGRAAQWRRRIALAGGGIGVAAVLGFAVLFAPSTTSLSGNEAYATLDSIRAAAGRAEGRTYRVRIERNPDHVPGPEQARLNETSHGRGAGRDAAREGELVLGPDRRYVLSWKVAGKAATVLTGFDGETYWVILPDGSSRSADSPMALRMPPLFAATDPAQAGDEQDEPLTLDAILSRLERGYEVTFADGVGLGAQQGSASPVIEVVATRRAPLGRGDRGSRPERGDRMGRPPERAGRDADRPPERSRRDADRQMDRPERGSDRPPQGPPPQTVRVIADASSFDVERLESTWTAGPVRSMTLERLTSSGGAARDPSWFTLRAQQELRPTVVVPGTKPAPGAKPAPGTPNAE